MNRRPADNPLGAGCAQQGEALFASLRGELARRGLTSRLWLARTYCLGLCPRQGAAVALSHGGALYTEATPHDSSQLIDLALPARP